MRKTAEKKDARFSGWASAVCGERGNPETSHSSPIMGLEAVGYGSKRDETVSCACAWQNTLGLLAQLVRSPACHAGGHGFESRTARQNLLHACPVSRGVSSNMVSPAQAGMEGSSKTAETGNGVVHWSMSMQRSESVSF